MRKFTAKELIKIGWNTDKYTKTLIKEEKKKFKKLKQDEQNEIIYQWMLKNNLWNDSNQNIKKENDEIKQVKETKKSNGANLLLWLNLVSALLTFAVEYFALASLIITIIILVRYVLINKKNVEDLTDLNDVNKAIFYKRNILTDLEENEKSITSQLDNKNSYLDDLELKVKKNEQILKEMLEQQKPLVEDYNFNLLYPVSMFETLSSYDIKNEISKLNLEEKQSTNINELINSMDFDNKSHVKNQLKQILTLFNTECEFLYSKLTFKNFDATYNKIIKNFESLNKLFNTDGVSLETGLLNIKLKKLELYHRLEMKLQEEAEIRKEERARIHEEQRAERELEKKRQEIAKEQKQFNQEVSKLMKYLTSTNDEIQKQLYLEKINKLNDKIDILESDLKDVENRLLNTRAGYVYVISNIGSFGENVYKIGVTRRLEPMDRVKELGDASVPFEFDVHAMIFSEDAPALENALHNHFRDKEINKINHRKEFFKVDLKEVEEIVKAHHNNTVNFEYEPIAEQYRESLKL